MVAGLSKELTISIGLLKCAEIPMEIADQAPQQDILITQDFVAAPDVCKQFMTLKAFKLASDNIRTRYLELKKDQPVESAAIFDENTGTMISEVGINPIA